jgi:hypothetical protein
MYTVGNPPNQVQIAFSGYADPSMRRDPAITTANPYGTNLWMLYSYPLFNQSGAPVTYSGAVETHLAYSNPNPSGEPGGVAWAAWCTTTPSCPSATAMWPSVQSNSPTYPYPTQFSSHEVPNFWPYNNNWYAVHLMYFVIPPDSIPKSIGKSGCFVMTVAQTTPTNLAEGWAANTLNQCGATLPNDTIATNVEISFTQLNGWSGASCSVWGEPAIMVDNTGPAYLAAACFNKNFEATLGYYIFSTSLASYPTLSTWTGYAGPIYLADLPDASFYQGLGATYLTEFDWARRADGTLVGMVSPAVETGQNTVSQFGCVVVNLNPPASWPSGSGSFFGSVVATLTDIDTPQTGTISEAYGPNACTYEPTSNTGVLIVRRLVNTALTKPYSPTQYQLYSLIDTGVMP